ncbi:MAG: HD domain-containing protein [Candidatus Woesearchaeota archaeon]
MSRQKQGTNVVNDIVDFLFELGQLKRTKRTGWWLINIKEPESVAEHSFRAAFIGYILAKMENSDPDKVIKMCLLQDICEARIGDLNKVAQRYINPKSAEIRALKEQLCKVPKEIAQEFETLFIEYHNDASKEGIIARDADLLECAFQAKEYKDFGHIEAEDWYNNAGSLLKTKSAKLIFKHMKKQNSTSWWHGLKEIKR